MKKASQTKSGRLAEKLRTIRLGLELSQNEILERQASANIFFAATFRNMNVEIVFHLHWYCSDMRVWLTSTSQF